jgi:hypothetical protein
MLVLILRAPLAKGARRKDRRRQILHLAWRGVRLHERKDAFARSPTSLPLTERRLRGHVPGAHGGSLLGG